MATRKLIAGVCSLGLLVTCVLAMGGARRNEAAMARVLHVDAQNYIVPATQIISFNDTIGRLDTSTGAIYQFRGNVDSSSVRNTWELRVPGVKGQTSGLLEIQRATFNDPHATFLVDVVTGETWILRRRGNDNGTWDPVPIFRR